jgi:hypothetical protein
MRGSPCAPSPITSNVVALVAREITFANDFEGLPFGAAARYQADGRENFVGVVLGNVLSQRPVGLLNVGRRPRSGYLSQSELDQPKRALTRRDSAESIAATLGSEGNKLTLASSAGTHTTVIRPR